jgi:monoterpene epsilon-lactone hydrolase
MIEPVSAQARMLRFVLRHGVKARVTDAPDLLRIRASVDAIARLAPDLPRGVARTIGDVGGVESEIHVPVDFAGDRHVLYLHGGGFVAGSFRTHRGISGRLARGVGARVLVPNYRLAPEHPFPAALDDSVAVYAALLAQGVSPADLALAGDSAGGNLVFALLLKLKALGLPQPGAAVGLSPFVDMTGSGDSMSGNAALDPFLEAAGFPAIVGAYAPGQDPTEPLLSPLFGNLSGLPPCFIQCGSDEILRDDAVRLHAALLAAGVSSELEVWARMPHVWQAFARFLPEARTAIGRIVTFLDSHLGARTVDAAAA